MIYFLLFLSFCINFLLFPYLGSLQLFYLSKMPYFSIYWSYRSLLSLSSAYMSLTLHAPPTSHKKSEETEWEGEGRPGEERATWERRVSLLSLTYAAHSCLMSLVPRAFPTPYGRVGSLHSPPTPFGREPAARMEWGTWGVTTGGRRGEGEEPLREASVRLGHKTLRTWMKNSSLW